MRLAVAVFVAIVKQSSHGEHGDRDEMDESRVVSANLTFPRFRNWMWRSACYFSSVLLIEHANDDWGNVGTCNG